MNSKKLFAGAVALAMAAAIVPSAGQAATAEELAAQIAQLQAQLASLMGQLGGTTTTTGTTSSTAPAACAGISFTRNLTLGSQGTDVQCLQALLNQDPATQVAASGVGSAGNESQYFGGLTKAAVVAFQNKYATEILAPVGLTAGTGFVGASTRAKLNAMLVGGTTGTTGETGTTGTTGTTLPEGCTSTAGYSPVTGESCSSTSTSTGTGLTMTGQEGSITVSINPSPANGTKTYEGDEKVAVMGLKVKATGSDVDVQRVTLQFGAQPYSYFTNVYLYDGDTQVASSALNSTTVSKVTSTNYQITLAGFTSKVIVPVNTDKVLTVKLDVLPGISSGLFQTTNTSQTINIGMPSATAVRAVDQAGLNQYGGVEYGDVNRSFTVNESQAANATLALSLNANSPKKRNIVADSNQEISGATLMTFDLKASKDDLIIDEILDVDFGASQIPATAYVVDDGGTVIGTISPSATAEKNDFTELDYTISKDTTKTLSIKVDDTLAAPNTGTRVSADDGDTYTVAIGTGKVGFTKSNGTTGTSTGTATSNAAYIYAEGPEFTLASITTDNTQAPFDGASSTMSATFNIQVKAVNGDVYISATSTDAFVIKSSVGGVQATLNDVTYVQPDNTVLVGGTYKVSEGNSATFAVKATASNGGVAGTYDIRVNSINWGHLSTTPTSVTSSYMNGEAAWISPAIYLR
ncbi:MAG TPA: peptidoglycan-binding domain-containing protein [Candidatus Pacearchaeota archaeon]|nr:peptidoglycan-binding domain-containing protein [Candidatus Pacearchaeota archaeon]